MTLLIVEDNPKVREMIKDVLSDLTETVYECGDGAQALHYYTAHRPDWVLMDIKMGEMDGIAATRQIKTVFSDARIIIVTNYDDNDLREAARQAGASAYVLKDNLLDIVRILGAGGSAEIAC